MTREAGDAEEPLELKHQQRRSAARDGHVGVVTAVERQDRVGGAAWRRRGVAEADGVRGRLERVGGAVDGGQLTDADGARDGEVPRCGERGLDEVLVAVEEPTAERRELALVVELADGLWI